MNDSFNYSGFSNAVITSRSSHHAGHVIDADQTSGQQQHAANTSLEHYPPYLVLKASVKNFRK